MLTMYRTISFRVGSLESSPRPLKRSFTLKFTGIIVIMQKMQNTMMVLVQPPSEVRTSGSRNIGRKMATEPKKRPREMSSVRSLGSFVMAVLSA